MLKDPNFREGMVNGVKDMGTTIVSGAENVAHIINEKIHDPNIKQNIVNVGSKIGSGVKSV